MATIGVDLGVTPTGFISRTLLDLKEEIEAAWRSEFGANVDLDPNQPDGQIIGIFSDRFAELWELSQAIYSSFDPDKAGGQAQDALCAITGTIRDGATHSSVTLTCTGVPTTVLSSGREASVVGTGDRFRTSAGATINAATAWPSNSDVTLGQLVTNDGNVYVCIVAGHTTNALPPTGTGSDITDHTAHWRFIGEGTGYANVAAAAVDTGPVSATAGSVTTIETPVSGWQGVYNLLDAEAGENTESNDHLRVKRESELAAPGSSTGPAIRAAVLKVPGVTSCVVFGNQTMTTDADGRPAKSVEAVVEGGVDLAVGTAVFSRVADGIQPYGTTTVTVTDSQGIDWTVGFTRPAALNLWVRVDLVVDADTFPVDGIDQVKAAIVGDEPNFPIGKNGVASRISSRCFEVPGVLDVTLCYIGLANPPIASTTVPAGPRERIQLDTARVAVNTINGVP
jgi:uncharacterized phage protein gp47/JayE